MRLEFISKFEEVIAKLNNSESLDSFHRIMISTRPIDMDRLVESIKNTKHNVIALTINSIKLTGDEIKKLEDVFTHCASLENLDLSNNDLTSKEAEILAGILANNKTVNSLSLNNNKIGDNGLKAFAKIAENSSIENLNFSDNNISDIGFKYWLVAHKKNSNLVEFHFNNNKIHNEGIETLVEFLPSYSNIKNFTIGVNNKILPSTKSLLSEQLQGKNILYCLTTPTKLLPDTLDVWVEEVIPEPESQQLVKEIPVANLISALQPTEQLVNEASSVSPVISNDDEEGLESNENKFNPETTLVLLDKYGIKFKTALEKGEILDKLNIKSNTTGKEEQKALIILEHPGSGKTTLANLFVHKEL